MLQALLARITDATVPDPDATQRAQLQSSLEDHMDDLVAHHRQLRAPLQRLLDAAPCYSCAMGVTYLSAALSAARGADGAGADADRLVVRAVEEHLLRRPAAFAQLRGHPAALRRLAQVLEGYVAAVGAGRRALHHLRLATRRLVPASGACLSVAHALLVRTATAAAAPHAALAVMRRPVLSVRPAETGAGRRAAARYFALGGALLADLRCWRAAAAWLRAALAMEPRRRRPDGDADLVRAGKLWVLLAAVDGGAVPPAERRRLQQCLPHAARGGEEADAYGQLVAAAAGRDGRLFAQCATHFSSVWQKDGTAELVAELGRRLRRHLVRDLAASTCRLPLADLLALLRTRGVCEEGFDETDATQMLLAMHEEGELRCRVEPATQTGGEVVVRLETPKVWRPHAPLGACRRGAELLCLSGIDAKRYETAQMRRAIAERITRCEAAHEALVDLSPATPMAAVGEPHVQTTGV